MTGKDKTLDLFGVDKDLVEKTKDILPTFDLGKLEVGASAIIEFLEDEPTKVKHKTPYKKEEIETPVIKIKVDTLYRPRENQEDGLIEIPMNSDMTLWLSSQSLSLGIARIYIDNNNSLKGKKAKISIGTANYKDYGENRCYRVSQVN